MGLRKSSGFTLVELLVVIAIIGMLVSILLPAVNSARAAGRRTQNLNNLKNIGLALLGHAEAKNSYPALRLVETKETKKAGKDYPKARQSVSWAFELLPFMEQSNIYDRFDRSRAVHDPANAVAMRTPIPMYANPQQREPVATCAFPGASATDATSKGTCIDYAANRGFYDIKNGGPSPYVMPFDPRNVGPFVHNAIVTQAHVRDGMTNTIAIGDRWVGPTDPDQVGLAGASDSTIMRGPIGEAGPNGVMVQPPFPVGNEDPSTDKFGGPRGTGNAAAFVFLDGHTRWVDYVDTDANVFRALCTIDGGEVVPE